MLEEWADGTLRDVTRNEKGHFITWRIVERPISPFFPVRKEAIRYEEPEDYYRVSVGMNYHVSNKYYGALIQEWFTSLDDAENALPILEEELLKMVEHDLGYHRSEWWFSYRIGQSVQQVLTLEDKFTAIERDFNAREKAQHA